MADESKKEIVKVPTRRLPTKFLLTARGLVGGYLIYVSYSLIDSVTGGEGRDPYFFGFFMVAFAVIGVILIAMSLRNYLRGYYVGGIYDGGDMDEASKEVVDAEKVDIIEDTAGDVPENTEK